MPLTPTDVANKQFRIAFRGYSLDEVDAFLDEVEAELSRLLRDNSELRQRPTPSPEPAPSPAAASGGGQGAPPPLMGLEGQEAALRTLLLAQRTADEAIAEARGEAEEIVSTARNEAERVRTDAERAVAAARAEADRLVGAARAEAEGALAASRNRAARLDAEVATQIEAATGDLEERRRVLEVRIEELRAFEREYRTRLKAYLTTQLRELDSRAGAEDGGAGVPADARTAAVGTAARGSQGTGGAAAGASSTAGPRSDSRANPPRGTAPAGRDDGPPPGPPREGPRGGLRAAPYPSNPAGPTTGASSPVPPTRAQPFREKEPPAPR